MALVTMPATPVPRKIDWTVDQPAQSNRGEFTGRRRVTLLPAAPRFYASVDLGVIQGEAAIAPWRAFVIDLDGIANRFHLVAVEGDQMTNPLTVSVRGAGQGGFTLATQGWGVGTQLRRGQFVTVADQLLCLMSDVVADGAGRATLSFKPYLRLAPPDGAAVEVRRPYAVMAMSDPQNGWSADIGKTYPVSFKCEEAF